METITTKKTKEQRIKMRIYKHPVKHDGTLIEFAPDGSWFVVQFDGPLPDTKFWKWSESIAIDKPFTTLEGKCQQMPEHCQLWEVL